MYKMKEPEQFEYATIAIAYDLGDVASVRNIFTTGSVWAAAEGIRVAVPAGTMTTKEIITMASQALCAPMLAVATQPFLKLRFR